MPATARAFSKRYSSSRSAGLPKLPEGPLHLGGKITVSFAIPAQVRLIESRAVERRDKIATRGIATVGLALRQFFAQGGHPSAKGTQKPTAHIGLFKHQPQHLLGMAGVVHFLLHHGKNGVLEGQQRLPGLWRLGKPLRYSLAEVFHAEGEQLLFGAEIAEKRAPRDSRVAADLFDCRPIEAGRGKQLPRRPLDLPKHELMFPFAKRTGILRFRPLFAASRANRFLHCMQIMAQSAAL